MSELRITGKTVSECVEPLPEGWGRPEPWKIVKLGDIVEIRSGGSHPSD